MSDVKIQWVKPSKLKPHPKNRNEHPKDQIERLIKLLNYQGWRLPIIVSNRSGFIVAGHGRLKAAKKMKMNLVPVSYQDFEDDDQEYAFLISDNAISEWASLNLSDINADLQELDGINFDIDLLGLKDFELEIEDDELDDARADSIPDVDDNEFEVKVGDIWQLGNHRIMCGDSIDKENIDKLIGGVTIDMIFTDPPYGIDFNPINIGGKGQTPPKKIINDSNTLVAKAFFKVWEANKKVIWGGNYFTDFLPVNGAWIVWNKMAFDKPDQPFSHCELAWTNFDSLSVKMFSHVWDGCFRSGNKKDEAKSRLHPNQKPVNMTCKIIDGDIIADPFLGSGSTLIACEKINKTCYGMELDPHYCSVIIKRWQDYTGLTAVKQG